MFGNVYDWIILLNSIISSAWIRDVKCAFILVVYDLCDKGQWQPLIKQTQPSYYILLNKLSKKI